MADIFAQKFPDVLGFIDQLSCNGIHDPDIVKAVNVLANQLGKFQNSDGMLKWASSAVATSAKECASAWNILPVVYANLLWQSCYDPKTKYEMKFDGTISLIQDWVITAIACSTGFRKSCLLYLSFPDIQTK